MADELRIGLAGLLRKAQMEHDADFLKEGVRVLSQALMEMEAQEHVGAARYERSAGRTGQRNGYRERDRNAALALLEGLYLGAKAQRSLPHFSCEQRLQVRPVDGGALGADLLLQLGSGDAREHLPAPGAYLSGRGRRAQARDRFGEA